MSFQVFLLTFLIFICTSLTYIMSLVLLYTQVDSKDKQSASSHLSCCIV